MWITRRTIARRIASALLLALCQCQTPDNNGPSTPTEGIPAPATTPAVSARAGAFDGCPPEGSARSVRVRWLNDLKNRSTTPAHLEIDRSVTLAALLEPGDDHARWNESTAADVTGYVLRVKSGGRETTNCEATDSVHEDTHIELVLSPLDGAPNRRMIVEVTPRWRAAMQAQGVDWSTSALKASIEGHWVKVRGWLFFDAEHRGQSENTAPGNPGNWRATAWEIHPITGIEVVPGPSTRLPDQGGA